MKHTIHHDVDAANIYIHEFIERAYIQNIMYATAKRYFYIAICYVIGNLKIQLVHPTL
jgi:hypothetical protein